MKPKYSIFSFTTGVGLQVKIPYYGTNICVNPLGPQRDLAVDFEKVVKIYISNKLFCSQKYVVFTRNTDIQTGKHS